MRYLSISLIFFIIIIISAETLATAGHRPSPKISTTTDLEQIASRIAATFTMSSVNPVGGLPSLRLILLFLTRNVVCNGEPCFQIPL